MPSSCTLSCVKRTTLNQAKAALSRVVTSGTGLVLTRYSREKAEFLGLSLIDIIGELRVAVASGDITANAADADRFVA